MYKVLEFDSEKAGDKLSHGGDVFHEALRKQLEYCHVYKDDQPLYDLQKIDNNYTIKTSKGAQDNGFSELFFNFNNYDENDDRTLNLSLIKRFGSLEIEELTEYSVVIAKLAALKLDMHVYVTDSRISLFMSDMANVHIVEELPGREDSMIITKDFVIGIYKGDVKKNHSIPLFSEIFSCRDLQMAKTCQK